MNDYGRCLLVMYLLLLVNGVMHKILILIEKITSTINNRSLQYITYLVCITGSSAYNSMQSP